MDGLNYYSHDKIQAEFRAASSEEIKEHKNLIQGYGWGWRLLEGTCNMILRTVNSIALKYFTDARTLFGYYIGMDPYLIPVKAWGPVSVFHITAHPEVMGAVLSYHRNDPSPDSPFAVPPTHFLIKLSNKYFSESKPEDSVILCNPEQTKVYRKFLHRYFANMNKQVHFEKIQTSVEEAVQRWTALPQPVNITEETRKFTTDMMCKLFLGELGNTEKISKAVNITMQYLGDLYYSKKTVPENSVEFAKEVFNEAVDKALVYESEDGKPTLVQDMKSDSRFTISQVKGIIFVLLIAGVDNTSTSLAHIILKLAQDPGLKAPIKEEIEESMKNGKSLLEAAMESKFLTGLMGESLRIMTPAAGIGRRMRSDCVLLIKDKGEKVIRKTFVPQGAIVSLPTYAARDKGIFGEGADNFDPASHPHNSIHSLSWKPFGDGPHRCPGSGLYNIETRAMAAALIMGAKLSTTIKGEPGQALSYTNKMTIDVNVSVKKED